MRVNIDNLVSISDANQNFSKVARLVDEKGSAVILKNNHPRYVLLSISEYRQIEDLRSKDIDQISDIILSDNMSAFKELAK